MTEPHKQQLGGGNLCAVWELRHEVGDMAIAMELKLRKNDHKSSWQQQPIEAHIKLLRIEMMEFDVALEFLGDEEAAKECVDIANYALIIRDKLRARMKALKDLKPATDRSQVLFDNSKDWTR